MGVSTLMKPLPSSDVIGFPDKVRMQVQDLGPHPSQNSTMVPTGHLSPAYSGVFKINADPWLKPVTFHSSTQQELGQSKSKFLWGPCCCFRFWCNWRGKEDPSMNPRKTANLLSAWKKPGSEHSILQSEEGHKNERVIDWLIYYFLKLGNSGTKIITLLLSISGWCLTWTSSTRRARPPAGGEALVQREQEGLTKEGDRLRLTTAWLCCSSVLASEWASRAKLLVFNSL